MERIHPDRIKDAAHIKGVTINDEEAKALSSTVALAELIHGNNFLGGNYEHFLGPGGGARFEDALPGARIALEEAIYVAKNFADHPEFIGKADPIAFAADDWLITDREDRAVYSVDVARAARRIHKAVIEALASLSTDERHLLKEAKLQPRNAGRPETGLHLARRIIIAVYFVWHHSGRSTNIPRASARNSGAVSELASICQVMLELAGLTIKPATIIATVNTYRAEVLLQNDPDLAFAKESRIPLESHFMSPVVEWKSNR